MLTTTPLSQQSAVVLIVLLTIYVPTFHAQDQLVVVVMHPSRSETIFGQLITKDYPCTVCLYPICIGSLQVFSGTIHNLVKRIIHSMFEHHL